MSRRLRPSNKLSVRRPYAPLAATLAAIMMVAAPEQALGFSTPFAATTTVPFRRGSSRNHHRHSSHLLVLRMAEESTNPEVAALLAAAAKARADADRLRQVRACAHCVSVRLENRWCYVSVLA
jgi:hypothetical protein